MISRFWWINFLLLIVMIVLVAQVALVWQRRVVMPKPAMTLKQEAWPTPMRIEPERLDKNQFRVIADKNLFNVNRLEHLPKPEPMEVPVDLPPVVEKDAEPEPEELEVLEHKDLILYGVIIMDGFKTAIVNNVDEDKPGKKQARVNEKEKIGEYTVEKILPKCLVVSYRGKSYRVPLFEKKERPEWVTPGIAQPGEKNAAPRVVNAGKSGLERSEPESAAKKAVPESEPEYEIVNTPFGKIKRWKQ